MMRAIPRKASSDEGRLMRNVVPDYAGFAEQCRKPFTKMAGKHKEALKEMARAWDGLTREHGQLNVASRAPDSELPPR